MRGKHRRWFSYGDAEFKNAIILFALTLLLNVPTSILAQDVRRPRPFAATSYWNVPIPEGAEFHKVPVIETLKVGITPWLLPDGVSIPVYQASPSDREWQILHYPDTWTKLVKGTWKNSGNSLNVERQIRLEATTSFPPYHSYLSQSAAEHQLPLHYNPVPRQLGQDPRTVVGPSNLMPSGSEDSHLVIVQPSGDVIEFFGAIILSNGYIICQTYQRTDPSLAGDGWQNGVTAAMIPVYAGLVRVSDLQAGTIDHAMKLLAPARLLMPQFVYPALSFDRGALTETPPYSGTVPMGARLALPRHLDLKQFGFKTPVGRMIGEAAQRYGFIVTDRGGSGISVVFEAASRSLEMTRWSPEGQEDLEKVIGALEWVTLDPDLYHTSEELLRSPKVDR